MFKSELRTIDEDEVMNDVLDKESLRLNNMFGGGPV